VPAVDDLLDRPGLGVGSEARRAPAGFINSQCCHRFGLIRQHRGGLLEEGRVDHWPGQAQIPCGLDDRAAGVGDRAAGGGAESVGDPFTGWDLWRRLGEVFFGQSCW
jgi:hypothetical protein